jgi:hypothetical protein
MRHARALPEQVRLRMVAGVPTLWMGNAMAQVAPDKSPDRSPDGGAESDLLDYESMHQPLASMRRYVWRLLASFVIAMLLVGASLMVGMAGYAHFEGMRWIDAFLNASMILSGMGPVDTLENDAAKIFAGLYAIFSGLVIVATTALILTPPLHRLLHRLHVKDEQDPEDDDDEPPASGAHR